MEGKKLNHLESDELNEFKYKYAKEKQNNEELNVPIFTVNFIFSVCAWHSWQCRGEFGVHCRIEYR